MPTVGLFAIGLTIVLALAVAWLWTARVRVSPKRVPMMTNRIAFPGGLRLHEPELALARLDEPEQIVIPFEHATLVIDYPLSTPASVKLRADHAGVHARRARPRDLRGIRERLRW
jgi:hypothetical protein